MEDRTTEDGIVLGGGWQVEKLIKLAEIVEMNTIQPLNGHAMCMGQLRFE